MAQYVDLMGGGAGSDSDDYIPNNIGSVYGAAQNYGPRNSGGGFAGGLGSAAYSAQTFGQAVGVEQLDDINTSSLIGKMNYLVSSITGLTKKILTNTAIGIKEMIRRSTAELEFNKANYVGMVIAQTSPIFGYFAAKFMESDVFADFAQRIKDRLGSVLDWIKNKYLQPLWRRLTGGRGLSLRGIAHIPFGALGIVFDALKWIVKIPFQTVGTIIKELVKLPYRALGAGLRALEEIAKLPWKALGLAFGAIFKLAKMPFKLLGLPFKMLGGLLDAFKWGWHWGNPPKAAHGAYVKREGMVNVHPGELIAPKEALDKSLEPVVAVLEDIRKSLGDNIGFFVRTLTAHMVPMSALFGAGVKGWAMGTKVGKIGLGAFSALHWLTGGNINIPGGG